jgi:aspartate aminotransferase
MQPPISSLAAAAAPSVVVEMKRKALRLAAAGMRIVDFGAGQPDFAAPEAVTEAAIRALRDGKGRYVDPSGLPSLREAIAVFTLERHGLEVDPEQVVVTPGSFGALSITSRAILEPGTEALLLEPFWGPYASIVRLTGAEPVRVPMRADASGRFAFDPDRIRAALTPRTRAIVLNSPWNPAGRVLEKEELRAVAEIALSANLWIVSDEIYSEILFDDRAHRSIAGLGPEVRARTVVINSLSKSFAMTGWRLGWCIAPAPLATVLGRINQYSSRCATSFVQHAGVVALGECAADLERMRRAYQRRRDVLVEGLGRVGGIACSPPEGTFYALASFDPSLGDSRALADRLLEEAGVVVTPGASYGNVARHHLRFSFATSVDEIEAGVAQLAAHLPAWRERQVTVG